MEKKNKVSSKKKNYFNGKNDLIVCKKLAKAFLLGLSDVDACYFADIREGELRKYIQENPRLEEKKKELQNRLQLAETKGDKWVNSLLANPDIRLAYYTVEKADPDQLAKEYQRKVSHYGMHKDEEEEDKFLKELRDIERKVYEAKSLETKELFAQSLPIESANYRGYMLEIEKGLGKEFNAQSVIEKSLCQVASIAFIGYLRANYEVTCYSFYDDYKHDQRKVNGYLTAVSKEKNNALRQFATAIHTLKNLNASPIKFNIIAQTLNMGQQQQINNTVKQ